MDHETRTPTPAMRPAIDPHQLARASLDECAAYANESHMCAEHAFAEALAGARDAGFWLLAAKDKLRHGEFKPWVEANFTGSYRTAAVYMQLADKWPLIEARIQDKSAEGSAPLSIKAALTLLAAPKPEFANRTEPAPSTSKTAAKNGAAIPAIKEAETAIVKALDSRLSHDELKTLRDMLASASAEVNGEMKRRARKGAAQ